MSMSPLVSRLQTRGATRRRPTSRTPGEPGGKVKHLDSAMQDGSLFTHAHAPQRVHGWSALPGPRLSRHQRDWVSRGSALTGHLAVLGQVSVRIISESVAIPWRDERWAMSGSAAGFLPLVWSRDVAISVNGTDCVLAHSVTPLRASHGPWQAMRRLRRRPLAELLYKDSKVRRSLLVSRYLPARTPGEWCRDSLYQLLRNAGHPRPRCALVARRSVFERYSAPLLITECFLPAFWQMLNAAEQSENCAC